MKAIPSLTKSRNARSFVDAYPGMGQEETSACYHHEAVSQSIAAVCVSKKQERPKRNPQKTMPGEQRVLRKTELALQGARSM